MYLAHDGIVLDDAVEISFQRTGNSAAGAHRPPRSYGRAPLALSEPLVIAGMDTGEAFWIGFDPTHPRLELALRVRIEAPEDVDAVTGTEWSAVMRDDPRNYLLVPPQRWLDGRRRSATDDPEPFVARAGAAGTAPCERICVELAAVRGDSARWTPRDARVRIVLVTPADFLDRTGRSLPPLIETDRYRGRRYP